MAEEERKHWLERRRAGLGGSDVAAIMGENPHMTALDVYLSKIGEVPERDGPALQRGRALEPIIRTIYQEKTGRAISTPSMIVDEECPVLIANVDGFVDRPAGGELEHGTLEEGVFEAKAPGLKVFSKMLTAGIPKAYFLQIQHYLGITGKSFGTFAAFNAERWQMLHFDVERDDELIRVMRRVTVEWWETHVVKRVPPAEERMELPAEFAAIPSGEITPLETPEWRGAVRSYLEAGELEDMAKELKEAAKAECTRLMGSFDVVEGGSVRAYNREQKGRTTFQAKELEVAAPFDPIKVREFLEARYKGTAMEGMVAGMWPLLAEYSLMDLSRFQKTGKPFRTFRLFPLTRQVTSGE